MPADLSRTPVGPGPFDEDTTRMGIAGCGDRFVRAGEITNGLIFHLGNIDRREVTRAHEPCQLHGVATVGFDPVANFFRNQGRGDDPTDTAFFREIPVEPGATGACFICTVC